jgi:hypothetical protein
MHDYEYLPRDMSTLVPDASVMTLVPIEKAAAVMFILLGNDYEYRSCVIVEIVVIMDGSCEGSRIQDQEMIKNRGSLVI